jgi:hypothetical protein
VGTHSLKACLLSWAAKAGLSPSDRKLLGNHISKADTSMVSYSRDALAGPLRALWRLLSAVMEGRFFPDKTRSGRWQSEVKEEQMTAGASSSGSSTSSENQESSSAEEGFENTSLVVSGDLQAAHTSDVVAKIKQSHGEVWRHNTRMTFHIMQKPGSFRCGRPATDVYSICDEASVLWPRCVGCFGSDAARSNFAFCMADRDD